MRGRPAGEAYNQPGAMVYPGNQPQPIPSTLQGQQYFPTSHPPSLDPPQYANSYHHGPSMQQPQPNQPGAASQYLPPREMAHPYSQGPTLHAQQYAAAQYQAQPNQQQRQPPPQHQRQDSGNQQWNEGEYYNPATTQPVQGRNPQAGQNTGGGDPRQVRDPRTSMQNNGWEDNRGPATGTALPESRQLLHAYIFDYFRKQGFHSAAQSLLQDAPDTPVIRSTKGKSRSIDDPSEDGIFSNASFTKGSPRHPDGLQSAESTGSSTTSHFGFNTKPDSNSPSGFSPQADGHTLPNAAVPVDTHQGMLFDWWAVFWEGLRARSGKGGEVATNAFSEAARTSVDSTLLLERKTRAIPSRPPSVASNLAPNNDFSGQSRPSSRNEQAPPLPLPNQIPLSAQSQQFPPNTQQLQQIQIREQHRMREQHVMQLSQAAQAAARTHVNPPQFAPIPLNTSNSAGSTSAVPRQATMSRRGGLVNVAPPAPSPQPPGQSSHEVLANAFLRQQQQQQIQLENQTRQNEQYSASMNQLHSNYHQLYTHMPPQQLQPPPPPTLKHAGQDPAYQAQLLRAHEMALRAHAAQQALTETQSRAMGMVAQLELTNAAGRNQQFNGTPRLARPPLISNNSAPLLHTTYGTSAIPADYVLGNSAHQLIQPPLARPTSAGPSLSNQYAQQEIHQRAQQEMPPPPPVAVGTTRRQTSAGSTPKALTPIAMMESPGPSNPSNTIKRKREVKDGRETKRRSAAVPDRPRSDSTNSNSAVTPGSTAASPALSVESPFVSSVQSPLAISSDMPRIHIDDSIPALAPSDEMYELFGFGDSAQPPIALDSSFFDLYCNDLSETGQTQNQKY